ncbi:MAG: PKD domain-containing protein [Gemmataceae bacterium]
MTNTPSSKATTVNLGNDPDTFVLVSTGANATVKVNGGGGKDDLSVYATGNLASTILNGDADDDTIYVDGIRLGSAVTVTGDTHSAGDTLIFDAHGKIYTKSNVAFIESIRMSTATYGVYYDTIENLKIIGSPTAKAGGSYNIAEGGSLTLNAGTSIIPSGQTLVGYEWNMETGVVTGVNPTLTWNDLKDYGITDNGTYTISVKITTALNGETYSNIDVATLTVTNKAPSLTLAGSSIVEVNSSYTLNLSSTDLGEDTVRTWTINWGDGSLAETYNGTPATATHVYSTESSSRTITATATDEDGSYTPITKSITVAAGRKLSGTATGSEGTPYTLTLGRGATGLPAIASWTVNWGDGSTQTVTGNPSTVNHTYLDDGSYGISAVATDVSNIPRPAGNTLIVTIADVAPVVTLSSGIPLAVEGRAIFRSLKVKTSDPGTDTVLNYTVDWGDDTSETVTGDVAELLHTYRDDGKYTVTVSSLTNDDGTFTNPSNSFTFVALSALPVIDTSRLNIPSTGVENVPINLSAVAKSVLTGSEPLTFTWTITPSGGVTYPATVGQTYLVPKDDPLGVEYASKNGITFLPLDNGTYTVTLKVKDDDGDEASVTRQIVVANQAPTIDTFQVPRIANEGDLVTLQASASDPAGAADPLVYTWTVTERGAEQSVTLNGSTAQWTSNGGEYAVRLEVSDGDGGKAIRSSSLMVTNTAPTITPDSFVVPSEANEGSTSTFSVLAEDDGSAANLTYLWQVIAPDGRVTELEGATVNYQWPDNGDYTVSVKVTDNVGATVIQGPVTVNVLNVKPVLQGFSLYGNREGDAVEIIGYAIDIAGVNDPLEFTWTVTAPNGTKTMLYGETIYYTLPDDGVYYVYVTVSDGDGGIDQANSSPAIYARNVNPTLGEIVLPTEPLFEGPTATLKVPAAEDVAGDLADLTYSWTVVTPSGTTLTSSELEMKVPLLDDGEYSATVVVTDGDGGRAEKSTTFTVGNVDPELVNLTVPSTGYLGFPIDLSALATDVPGDTADLVYNWTLTLPNLQTVTFTGTQVQYTPDVAGSIQVALSITDNDGGTVTSSRTIDVLATPIRFTQFMLPEEINEASFVTVKASAVDELGGAVTYQWTITPPNEAPFQLKGNSASFYAPDNGDFLVSVVAKSSNGEAESSAVVRVVNVDPDLISVNVGPDATTNQPLSLSAVATDVAGSADPLKYDWKITYPDGNVVILTGKNVTFTPTQLGFHGLELKVSDGDGGVAVSRKLIPVLNEPPVASTGGPYTVSEYGTLMLDALTGSSDANQSAESLVYVWDLDNDGIFGESSTIYGDERGSKPTFKAKIDGPATLPVRVRVTDIAGVSTIDDGEVRVKNVVPTASLSGPSSGVRGQTRTINLSATDPSPADIQAGFTYTIHWGDGQSETVPASQNNGSGVQRSHIYSANGDYTVTIRATDKDGGISAPVRMVIRIREMAVQDGVLVIGGTTGNDQIDIKPGNGRGNIRVALNNQNYGPYSNVTRIEVYGQAGNDNIQIYGNVAVQAMIDGGDGHDVIATRDGQDIVYGGAGNDVIKTGKGNDFVDGGSGNDFIRGEAGNDILLGGIGNDSIEGGIGRDVIIGGIGADALDGQGDDDLLIAGSTTFDHHYQALGAILSEWTSAQRQSLRVANLRGTGSGPRANGSVFLVTSGPDATVSDDHDVDQINGASGQDWFLVTGNGVQDRIRDRKKGDTVGG